MELLKDSLDKNILLDLSTKIGRAGHQLKSICQNFVGLSHPEMLTIDNIAGNIEGEARNLKAHLVANWEIRYITTAIARGSTFLNRISSPDFFKDSTIKPEVLAKIQSLASLIVQATKSIETQLMIAQIKHSQSVFGSDSMFPVPQVPAVDMAPLSKFGVAPSELPSAKGSNPKEMAEATGEYLANLAHITQETVDNYVNHETLKPLANKIINLSGAVENEARACITHSRKAPKLDANGVKKAIENAKIKIAEEAKLVDEQKEWVPKVKETLKQLFDDQMKAIGRLGEIAAQA